MDQGLSHLTSLLMSRRVFNILNLEERKGSNDEVCADPLIHEWVQGSKERIAGADDALLAEAEGFGGRSDSYLCVEGGGGGGGGGWLFPFSFSEVSTNRSPLDGCRTSIQLVVGRRKIS